MSLIRQSAFTGSAPLLKGGLHCHTTRSDCQGAPEDVIRLHAQNGYDFLALTDHRRYNYENFAPETGVLVLPGMEMDRSFAGDPGVHCFHTVCLGTKDSTYAQDQRFDSGSVRGQEDFQPLLDELHAAGQMTFYCHPEWSNTPAREFERLQGNFAMEIWNSGCAIENGLDTDAAYWDELLRQGQRIFGVAVDDGHAMAHHCKGWVRVRAEKDRDSILAALREGAFYSSCGPEIRDFYIEDGRAVLLCSPCAEIAFRSGQFPCPRITSEAGDLTRHEFELPEYLTYIRAVVRDAQGRRAWTNPIFLA